VHHAGAQRIAAGGAAGERLHERAVGVTGGGMHDDARRLVDDEQVLVLPHHLVRGRGALPRRDRRARVGLVDVERLPLPHPVPLARRGAVHEHLPGGDQPLRAAARAEALGEQHVEALALLLRPDGDAHRPAP
jgi:hypothetical protein